MGNLEKNDVKLNHLNPNNVFLDKDLNVKFFDFYLP